MVKRSNLLIIVFATLIVRDTTGFTTSNRNYNNVRTANPLTASPLNMVATAGNFFDDFNPRRRDDGEDSSNTNKNPNNRVQRRDNSNGPSSKFVTGDDLHRLRHQVLAMRLELQEARRNGDGPRVKDLERAIMKTQQVDAEFVYTVSLEREELAHQDGDVLEAQRFHQKATEARSALPQFQLEGLWVGKYGEDQGYEMINVTYSGDTLLAHKVTSGTKHVPRGAETFRVNLSPHIARESSLSNNRNNHNRQSEDDLQEAESEDDVLLPIELGDSAAKQWGCKYLQRFVGQGQVASEGYQDSQWMEGQLILVNEYFSFAWLPIGHQVFFGRPTPELILKLMKDETKRESANDHLSPARSFLEKCWEETEHIADDMEVDREQSSSSASYCYFEQEGCFE
mmetsp:Transcript_11574/g.24550  ORF Transcript_11574/g.24550 Transcript_11574/m.24550 type:complete len:397 (+) Transcript_11574:310-1500(+)|eukprot:CAMPEP_0201125962 /NCGR_PEP_ID=MMETSP0850-20130426/24026_1 /ASSEMBLY_ACC=CAM_ASM_000622 /TAXON_ID=183588 /ORGANISM="Pseudo-nitzschia fraudulenta, Strain WWA7" /LENGTH=396 /DNA_ID=CAMNT_0047394193 /DNA_START=313 /DNA_END=1503 /DNA_ORIENTATION=+